MKVRFSVFFLCVMVILLFSGCYLFAKSDTCYGFNTLDKDIIFLVDTSGSMEGKNEGNVTDKLRAEAMDRTGDKVGDMIGGKVGGLVSGQMKKESTKLASAKRELLPAIRGLQATTNFTVITFSSKVDMWKKNLVPATEKNKSLAMAYVKNLSASGGTSAMAGLTSSFSLSGADIIFFLSDGHPSDAGADTIIKRVDSLNTKGKVSIYSIGLGDDKDEAFMKELADKNNGKYVER